MPNAFLSGLFWEYEISETEMERLLAVNDLNEPLTVSLYNRILLSRRWYDILRQLTPTQLQAALSERVLRTIYSRDMRRRYRFAAQRLLGQET